MKRSGFTLYGTLWLLALLSALSAALWVGVNSLRERLNGHKQQQQAAAMAISGREYLQTMVASGRWYSAQVFRSPVFEGGGYFTITIDSQGRAVVSGCCGRARQVSP